MRVPALVDLDLWDLAQAQLARNRERATRNNTKHEYLLWGLLVCGQCGRRLIGVWSRVSSGRSMCSARLPRPAPWRCLGRSVAAARIEPLVWNYVRELLSESEVLRARYAEGRGDPLIDEREERERERLERKLQALDGECNG